MSQVDRENDEIVDYLSEMLRDYEKLYISYIKGFTKKALKYSRISSKRLGDINHLLSLQPGVTRVGMGVDGTLSDEDYFVHHEDDCEQKDGVGLDDVELDGVESDDHAVSDEPLKDSSLIKPDKPEKPISTRLTNQAQMGRLLSAHLREKTKENGVNTVYMFLCCPHCEGEIRVEASATPIDEPDDSLPF